MDEEKIAFFPPFVFCTRDWKNIVEKVDFFIRSGNYFFCVFCERMGSDKNEKRCRIPFTEYERTRINKGDTCQESNLSGTLGRHTERET